jgi:N-acetylglucosamine-6-sulfatase
MRIGVSARLTIVTVLAALMVTAQGAVHSSPVAPEEIKAGTQPNIVLIVTDDQNRVDLRWMPQTRELLGGHGVTFTRALSPDPLCCPARAELLTGQLGQNNGVRANFGPHGGFRALEDSGNTLASWLQAAGYQTALVGKYLNRYKAGEGLQPGWTIWNPTIGGQYSYDHTRFYGNGTPVTHTTNVTPVISAYSTSYIQQFAATGKPFFLYVSHVAPHRQEIDGRFRTPLPTEEHQDDLLDIPAPSISKPSFNRLGTPPWPYPALAGLHQKHHHVQHVFTRRIQSLLDVDDSVAATVAALQETGQLDNTYIFLVSDNANLLGEHAANGKDVLYREALEVPLVVRVPDLTGPPHTSTLPVAMPDIAPTIAQLAGVTPGRVQDGRSFADVLSGGSEPQWRDTQLIQTGDNQGQWTFRGVKTRRFSYLYRVSDHRSFLYDHRRDPYELHDLAHLPRYHSVRVELHRRMVQLENCTGDDCNQTFGRLRVPHLRR